MATRTAVNRLIAGSNPAPGAKTARPRFGGPKLLGYPPPATEPGRAPVLERDGTPTQSLSAILSALAPDWTGTRLLSETVRVRIPPGPRHATTRFGGPKELGYETTQPRTLVRPPGPAARVDGRSPSKRERAGSNPARAASGIRRTEGVGLRDNPSAARALATNGPAARLDGRSPSKRERAGSSPAGWLSAVARPTRSQGDPATNHANAYEPRSDDDAEAHLRRGRDYVKSPPHLREAEHWNWRGPPRMGWLIVMEALPRCERATIDSSPRGCRAGVHEAGWLHQSRRGVPGT